MKKIIAFLLLANIGMSAQTASNPAIAADNAKLYRTPEVDSKPELKDGMYTLSLFISQHFTMPEVQNKKLKLFVGFVVETDGTISDIKFIHLSVKDLIENPNLAPLTDEEKKHETAQLDNMKTEAVRVLSLFKNKWNPAVKDGKPVRCQYNYPINFNIE